MIAATMTMQPAMKTNTPVLPIGEVTTSYYLRLRVVDRAGVMAELTRILADLDISIDALLQKESREGEHQTDIIILTHQTQEKHINAAIAKIEAMETVLSKVTRIRMEALS